jgi:hypothetical protein
VCGAGGEKDRWRIKREERKERWRGMKLFSRIRLAKETAAAKKPLTGVEWYSGSQPKHAKRRTIGSLPLLHGL